MSPTIYVENWAPYSYLVTALLRVKPVAGLQVRPYQELDHPLVGEDFLTSIFVAYQDELAEPTFSFLAVAEALDRRFTEVRLCGADAVARALVRSVCQVIDEGHLMLATSRIQDFPGYRGPMWSDGSRAPETFYEAFFKKMRIVERYAKDDEFLLGGQPSIPDVIVAACAWFAEDIGIDGIPEDCRRLRAWHKRQDSTGLFRHPAK